MVAVVVVPPVVVTVEKEARAVDPAPAAMGD